MKPRSVVWGLATLMVTIVSGCSLIGVSIMPLISGPNYKIFITLFTGLAVGSLLGSAIFSLIPQAFSVHMLTKDKAYLWKSLIIFFGIYLFYCSERLMRIYLDKKTKKNSKDNHQLEPKKSKSNNNVAGASGDNQDENRTDDNMDNLTEVDLANDSVNVNNDVQTTLAINHHNHHHHHHQHGFKSDEFHNRETAKNESDRTNPVQNRRKEIAPVAWMIIIGDGLHNFIDGLSIGAAFSESVGLGFSTSLAVIFEEFPHELGDFAVLISSGMTVRQALGFNFISACTCYIGMIFGIILGDIAQSAAFIFALAGGMFLYISLVDMMGELSAILDAAKGPKEVTRLFLMQNLGILSGIIIIFTLSLYSNG